MAPDINILLAASRTDHVHHQPALGWLRSTLTRCASGESIEILPMVGAGFLRLATNRRVFTDPMPAAAALAFIESVLAVPGATVPAIGSEWPLFRGLIAEHGLMGNEIPDAWVAAAVKSLGLRLVTFDRGFRKWLSRSELTILETA
jgi:toxin-antitoxin system PIN domain toxin